MLKSCIGLKKTELDTPCLTIDINLLKCNLAFMQSHSINHKINIRPHAKTHKCTEIAKMQISYGAIGISVAKVSEAVVLTDNGISNILITSPIIGTNKIEKLLRCMENALEIIVVVDNEKNIADLNAAAQSIGSKINVLVDIDPGIGRTGVALNHALDFAKKIKKLDALNLLGIQCYAGNLQHIKSYNDRRDASLKIMNAGSHIVKLFEKHGIACPIFTGAGTGTYDIDIASTRLTEIQPGSYVVMDTEYSDIESKNGSDLSSTFYPSMTLLTTVISSNRYEHVTVDAGTKSIYVDFNQKPKIISHNNLQYDWGVFGDEHGKITSSNKERLPTNGEVIELILPHCDPTINLFDQFFITDNDIVIDVWPIDLRGHSQ